MTTFNVWIVLLTEASVEAVTTPLLRQGYNLGPLAQNKQLTFGKQPAILGAFIAQTPNEVTCAELVTKIKDSLAEKGVPFLGLIVTLAGKACSWYPGVLETPVSNETIFDKLVAD